MPGNIIPIAPNPSRLKSVAFFSFHADDALSVLRMYGPANAAGLDVVRGVESGSANIQAIDHADLVIIQRDFCKDYPSFLQIMERAHSQGKPVILDLDDNLFVLPEDHPDRLIGYYTDSLLPTFQAVMDADLITAATRPLREYLLPFNKNIEVLPNYLDDSLWKLTTQEANGKVEDKIIIGYMGGSTHLPDLQLILPVLVRLLDKYPDRLVYHFWGIEAPAEIASHSKVDWYPPVFFRYDEFVYAFQDQKAHILLAPLCDDLFNSCKSAIKYLEYGAIGVAGVFSRVAPYIDIVQDGKDGLLAATPDEWFNSIVRLIESPSLRAELAMNAQEKIRTHWLLSRNVEKWINIYQEARTNYRPKESRSSSAYDLQKSITQQYYEEYLRKISKIRQLDQQVANQEGQISALNHQVGVMQGTIADLENEVVSYATSHSWRLTRPLRAFLRLIRRFIRV